VDHLQSLAQQAVAFHNQGNLAEAEKLYLQILAAEPGLFGPRYYMGLLRLQQDRPDEAVEYLGQAVQITPTDLAARMNYGMALRAARRSEEALAQFDAALVARPDLPEAHYNRGVALADLTRFEEAVGAFERAQQLQPEFVGAGLNRGVALAALGRLEDALVAYARVLAMQPGNVVALTNRGLALRALNRQSEAVEAYERALVAAPDHVEARYNLAVALMDLARPAQALAHFEEVLAARGGDAELLNNRGVALWNLKRPAEALASLDAALALEPDFTQAMGNRALALKDMGRLADAQESLDELLRREPGNAVAWNTRGTVMREMKRFDEAVADFGRAIALRPTYAEALNNRGYTQWADLHQYAPALADLERALALDPEHPYALGEVLHLKMYGGDWHGLDGHIAAVTEGVRLGQRVVRPFVFQAISGEPEDLQACSRIWARDQYAEIVGEPHERAPRAGQPRIRIGYVSGEFREQATAILMAGLYERHDRDRFEIVAIDNSGVGADDAMRARLKKNFDRWIDISAMSDEDAAAAIRAAGIDILVNLNGYFGRPRMGVFARRPAPLQVNYLGFPATLGAAYIDYLIADAIVIPPGEDEFYDEKIVRLPGCYQANDDKGRAMAARPSRAQAGLPEDGFVFCNFNNAYKLTPETFASWMRILGQVDNSVLWLLEARPPFADNLAREAKKHGIDPARIIYAPDLAPDQHLTRLGLADLFLDGLPYNAHTTASDALWAGVPLLTQRGTAFAGRVAASILTAAGLPELVTETAEDYEALAVTLAQGGAALAAIRAKVAARQGTLFDTAAFARGIEAAYAAMWQRWLDGKKAESFSV